MTPTSQEVVSNAVANTVTKDELLASVEDLCTEMRSSFEMLCAEQRAMEERLLADIRAFELGVIRWNVGTIFGAAAIIIAALKLLP